jgi:hypothetical protein
MDVGRRFLDEPAEREARNDLRGGRDGDPDQFRTVGDDRREEPFAEQPNVGILLFIADDLHQVLGRVNGIRAELIVDHREPGREVDRGQHFEPLVDQKEAFPVGFHVVEALAAKRILRQFNAVDQIGKPVERFSDSR